MSGSCVKKDHVPPSSLIMSSCQVLTVATGCQVGTQKADVISIVIDSLVMMGSQHVRPGLCCLVRDSGCVSEQVGSTEWGFRQGSEQACLGGVGVGTRSAWLTQVIRQANEV